MVVIASRQTGARPETIRTRLARFMPSPAAAGWTIAWAAHTEQPAEIGSQDELAAAEHLGCYGAAVTHALAQAEVAPVRLRVTAEALASSNENTQPITIEVRAQIAGAPLDQDIFEGIVRRADPACAVWQKLASEHKMQVVAVLEDPTAADAIDVTASVSGPVARKATPASRAQSGPGFARVSQTGHIGWTSVLKMVRPALPAWIKPRTAGMFVVALGVFAVTQHNLLLPG
jgi:organic hydroperoxide reductase OsmC/OhrA